MTQSLRDQFLASPSEDETHADQGTSLRDQFLSAQAPTRPLLTRPTPQPPSDDGDFMRGLKRTLPELKQLAGGTLAAVGDVTGWDGLRDKGLEIYRNQENTLRPLIRPTDSASEAWNQVKQGNFGAGVDFLQNAAGYTTGQALESLTAMGAGAALGAAVTPELAGAGSIPGAIGGFVGRQALKRAVKGQAEKIIAEQVAQGVARREAKQAGAEFVAQRATRDALDSQLRSRFTQAQINRMGGSAIGGAAGAQGMNTVMELGSVYPEAYQGAQEEGRQMTPGEKARAVGGALAAAGVESAADLFNVGRLGHALREAGTGAGERTLHQAAKDYGKRALVEVPEGMLREAGTEAVQTGLERFGARQNLTDAEAVRDYIDSAAVGAVGGGLFGGAAAIRRPSRPQVMVDPQTGEAKPVPSAGNGPISGAVNAGVENGAIPSVPKPTPTITVQEVTARAQAKLDALNRAADGTPDTQTVDDAGNAVTVPGERPRILADNEKALRTFLTENIGNPDALARFIGMTIQPEAGSLADAANAIPRPQTPDMFTRPLAEREADAAKRAQVGAVPDVVEPETPPRTSRWMNDAGVPRAPTHEEATDYLREKLLENGFAQTRTVRKKDIRALVDADGETMIARTFNPALDEAARGLARELNAASDAQATAPRQPITDPQNGGRSIEPGSTTSEGLPTDGQANPLESGRTASANPVVADAAAQPAVVPVVGDRAQVSTATDANPAVSPETRASAASQAASLQPLPQEAVTAPADSAEIGSKSVANQAAPRAETAAPSTTTTQKPTPKTGVGVTPTATGATAQPQSAVAPTTTLRAGVRRYSPTAQTAQAYYQPGRVVPSDYGQDRVLAFRPEADGKPWAVQVQAVDKAGNPTGEPRWHATFPEKKELNAVLGAASQYSPKALKHRAASLAQGASTPANESQPIAQTVEIEDGQAQPAPKPASRVGSVVHTKFYGQDVSPSDLVKTKTVYGKTVYVHKDALADESSRLLPMYVSSGKPNRKAGRHQTIHRENLDADGSKRSAMPGLPYYADTTRNGEKPFKTAKQAEKAVTEAGQRLDDYEIKEHNGGFVAVRRATKADAATNAGDVNTSEPSRSESDETSTGGANPVSHGFKPIPGETAQWAQTVEVGNARILYNLRHAGGGYRLTSSVSWPGQGITGAPAVTLVEGRATLNDAIAAMAEHRLRVEARAGDGPTQVPPPSSTMDQSDKIVADTRNRVERLERRAGVTQTADQFANNKMFTSDKVAAAKARLKAKLGQLNSGVDPELFVDGVTIAGAYIESGVRKFADYAKAMVEDLGDAIKPYLLSFYEGVRHFPGVERKGMDSADEAARQFDALLTPADVQTDAIGQSKPPRKTRAKATTDRGARTLRDDWGVDHINGYSNTSSREEGNDTKDAFLKDASAYLKAVAEALEDQGYTVTLDRKGKPAKAVSVNESGMAGSGDVYLHMVAPDGTGIYVHVGGTTLRGVVPSTTSGIALMYRTSDGTHGKSGANQWGRTDLTAAELAAELASHVQRHPWVDASNKGTLPVRVIVNVVGRDGLTDAERAAGKAPLSDALTTEKAHNPAQEAADAPDQANRQSGQPPLVPGGRARADGSDAAVGDADRGSVDAGLAGAGEGAAGAGDLFAGASGAGRDGSQGAVRSSRDDASGEARDRGTVRAEPGTADAVEDFDLTGESLAKGGLATKYRENVAAIRIVKALEAEGRVATPEERKQLARYVGWGALKGVFDQNNKQWAKQHAELKELLTSDEYAAARASTRNAHFTSQEVVAPMIDGLQRLGFTRGRLLEPSVGTGNFFGMMPARLRQSAELFGVELDPLTSKIAAGLYPSARITNSGFEDYQVPGGFFDAAIGNPPFGEEPIADSERSPYSGFSIHNYFLAKTIDKLRPGGVAMMVVSHNFLDARDNRARKWIAQRANLVAAVRLPDTAFKGNAGTEVVTDVLVFQKHQNGIPNGDRAWVDSGKQKLENPKTGESSEHNVNAYFLANPKNVLGEPTAGGSMYRANDYTVKASGDLATQLTEWVNRLPEGIYQPIDRTESMQEAEVPDGIKVGSYYVDGKGVIQQRGEDTAGAKTADAWTPPNAKAEARMRGMIAVRDALRAQMLLERDPLATDKAIAASRNRLNKAYDTFLKEHGYLNSPTNYRLFKEDSDSDLVQALEFDYDNGISKAVADREGIEPRAASARKADIFDRRVAFPQNDMQAVFSAKDALIASLNYRGTVDPAYMARVYGKDQDAIVAELGDLVYSTPEGGIETADAYLSGDVKTKLAEAEAAAKANSAFARNVKALKAVIPTDKSPSEIHVSLGAHFVPSSIVEDFIEHITGAKVSASYVKSLGRWMLNKTGHVDEVRNAQTWGTPHIGADKIIQQTIDGRTVVVTRTEKDGDSTRTIVLEAETEAAREKQNAIRNEWKSWLWRDPERGEKVLAEYNDKMNRTVRRRYDGSHLSLPGKNPAITLLKHQLDGIWRGLQSRQILLDHVVGAGKTFQIVGMIMEMRRLGIARKPVLAVPNHLTLQWRSEFTRLYPGARVLAARPEDFSKENRPKLFSKIVTGDWDAVILGHSSLKKIGLPSEVEANILKEQIDDLAKAIEEIKRERGDRNIVRDMEGIKRNLEAKMKERLSAAGPRDKVLTFDELGLDALGVDELHEFKNLTYSSTMTKVPGMGNPKGSARAFDLFMKTQWLFKTYGDQAPLITATGTPVSNSLVEMYNVQRYMQYPQMKRDGLHMFDAWARAYGSVENVYEVAPSGSGFRASSRFAKFQNLSSLMADYLSFADVITLDDLKVQEEARGGRFPVPKVKGGRPQLVVAPRSPLVADFMGVPKLSRWPDGGAKFKLDLTHGDTFETEDMDGKVFLRMHKAGDDTQAIALGTYENAEEARAGAVEAALTPEIDLDEKSVLGRFARVRELTRETKGKVNALSLTGEANKAGLDYRLIDPNAPDFPDSKINRAVDNIVAEHKAWAKDKGTQLVFCDMSVPISARAALANKPKRAYVRDTDGSVIHRRATLHSLEGAEELPFLIVEARAKTKDRPAAFAVYDAATGHLMADDQPSRAAAKEWAESALAGSDARARWIKDREASGELQQEEIDEYNDANEIDTAEVEAVTLQDIAGVSASAGFSVYDDMRAKLIKNGIPEREIAFIHDYSTPSAKAKLFAAVNRGDVRVLFGSTPKMGAGTNVQERAVALHHIDAPWKPSDLEQREGRVIRRGNKLYDRDPEGFEVGIYRYATAQTYDARRWQILEHKARGIEQLRNFDGSINEIDDIDGEASNAADMKAAASGDPLILRETQLRNDVKRLENLESAHADNVVAARRAAQRSKEEAEKYLPRKLKTIETMLAERLPDTKEGVPTGSAVGGKKISDRKEFTQAIARAVGEIARDVVLGRNPDDLTIKWRGLSFEVTAGVFGSVHVGNDLGDILSFVAKEADNFSASGLITRMNNAVDRLDAQKTSLTEQIEEARTNAERFIEEAAKPFADAENLASARRDFKSVQRLLLLKGPDLQAADKKALDAGLETQRDALRKSGLGDALDEMLAARRGSEGMFSRADNSQRGSGLSMDEGHRLKRELTAHWGKNAPRVVLVESGDALRDVARQQGVDPSTVDDRVEGMYLGKPTVWVNLSAIHTPERFEEVLTHEALGHYGVERVVGKDEWAAITDAVNRHVDNGTGAKDVQAAIAQLRRTQADIFTIKDAAKRRDTIAKEVIAVMAEHGSRNGLVMRVVAAVRKFLRKLNPSRAWSDAEIRDLLHQADRFLHTGRSNEQAQAMTRAYAFSRGVRSAFEDAANFASSVRRFYAGNLGGKGDVQVTQGTPDVYAKLGVADKPFVIRRDKLADIRKEHPEITEPVLMELVRHLHEPVAVFQSGPNSTNPNGLVALTELEVDGKPVVIALHLGIARKDGVVVNRVASYYGKDSRAAFLNSVGTLRYLDESKTPAWFPKQALLPKGSRTNTGVSAGKVLTEQDVVKPFSTSTGAYSQAAPTFYSALLESVDAGKGAPKKGDAAAWKGWLDGAVRRGEFRQAERDWMGLDAWLNKQSAVTRDQIADYIRANQVQVQEVVLGEAPLPNGWRVEPSENQRGWFDVIDDEDEVRGTGPSEAEAISDAQDEYADGDERAAAGGTKFGQYQLPGGENYRELLLTLPPANDGLPMGFRVEQRGGSWGVVFPNASFLGGFRSREDAINSQRRQGAVGEKDSNFRSSHFDQPNILAHVRFNERTDADGKRVLFIEEIQSDWAASNRRALNEVTKPEAVGVLGQNILGREMASMMALNQMDGGVLSALHHDQVRRAVIADLPVDVVNDLIGFELTPEQMLSNPNVVVDRLPVDHLRVVADGLLGAMRSVGATLRAKLLLSSKARGDHELLPALRASDLDTREVVGLLAPERIYHLGLPGGPGRSDSARPAAVGGPDAGNAAGRPLERDSAVPAGSGGGGAVASRRAEPLSVGVAGANGVTAAASVTNLVDWHTAILRKTGSSKQAGHIPGPIVSDTESYVLLAFKRMVRIAAEQGFDRIAWTTGEQQAERYALSRKLHTLIAAKSFGFDSGRLIELHMQDGSKISLHVGKSGVIQKEQSVAGTFGFAGKGLDEVIGKPLAEQVMANNDSIEISGNGLNIGGAGMRAFYDNILPKAVNKWAKRFGAKVGEATIKADGYKLGDIQSVHRLDVTPAMRDAALQGLPLFSRAPAEELASIEADMRAVAAAADGGDGVVARIKQWLKDATPKELKDRLRGTWLGALTTRMLTTLGQDYFQTMRLYTDFLAEMQASRNEMQQEGEDVAETVRKWAGKNRQDAERLFDTMHEATIAGVDPAEAYQPLTFKAGKQWIEVNKQNVKDRIAVLRDQMLGRGGDSKQDMMNEVKALRAMLKAEPHRKAKYPALVAKWNQLSPEAQQHYRTMRELYSKRHDATEAALIQRINDLKMDGGENRKRVLIDVIRQQFEAQRRQGVYFPLQRFGQYFVAAEKNGVSAFQMYGSLPELKRAVAALRARDYAITAQGLKSAGKAKDAPSGTFVAEVIEAMDKAHVSEQVQDEIYQMYLQALPELSMRKHKIHRKSVPGWDTDALRAFSFNMLHGAHQIARLQYAHKLSDTIDVLQAQQDAARKAPDADTARITAGDHILEELRRRHEWIMNPQDSNLTNLVTSAGFTYYLGLTPAAALVNLTQVPMITLPYLGSRFGHAAASKALFAAMKASARTGGHIQKTLTSHEDIEAHKELQRSGALDKTQVHNLAGIAEGGMAGFNPKWAKAMAIVGLPFHKAEVINREATGMAAFRLARAEGKSFDEAVKFAADAIHETQFDYSNQNRARYMQSGPAKVLLMFRQYSQNLTWHIGRMVFEATKHADPDVRRIARRNLAGVLGMSALFSGTLGLPLMSVTMGILNAIAASAGDDDEPWDAETEFRAFLNDMLGKTGANVVLHGAANAITGSDIASRVSYSDLWFRDADRELDGRGQYYNLLEQAAGPMGGVLKNVLVGKQMIDEGHVMRGVETMMPKAIKDAIKAVRYADEGVNNLRGDPIVASPGAASVATQLIGFTPAEVSERYAENRSLKNYEQYVIDRRRSLMDGLAMAIRLGDADARAEAMGKIRAFNRTWPQIALTPDSIRRSLRSRARYDRQAENGIMLNRKIAGRVRDAVGVE